MDIKTIVAEKAVKWLLGNDLFNFISEEVKIINDENISGTKKRNAVYKKAKKFFSTTLSTFINIGIEIAVLVLKSKMGKK